MAMTKMRSTLRATARAALEAYFQAHSLPRFTLGLLLILTGAAGFLASVLLLKHGVDRMAFRYPLAACFAYGVFLGLIRIWVEIERARFDPRPGEVEGMLESRNAESKSKTYHQTSGGSSWLDYLDIPNVFDLDAGCLPVLIAGAVIALGALLFMALANAPAFMAEVFLDAFIVSVLYRRLRIAAQEHWLGTAIRKTWLHVFLAIALLCLLGWGLDSLAPGSHSIGPALRRLWRG
jgi:hypothetical protein